MTTKLKYIAISILTILPAVSQAPVRAGGDEASEAMGCFCRGTVGNVDCDYADAVGIEDLQLLIDHLFFDFARLPNVEEANCDGDAAGMIDIVDLQVLIDHLFLTHVPLPSCPAPPNNPPETGIIGQHGSRFINAVGPTSPVVGVRVEWNGSDLVDHPYYPPPFEFEWRLFGPYDDSLMAEIRDLFMVPVFIANDNQIYRKGLPPDTAWDTIPSGAATQLVPILIPTSMVVCDTTYDSGLQIINCDTLLIDTISADNEYGSLDTVFDVENPGFTAKTAVYNRVAAESFNGVGRWVQETSDTIYDVFRDYPLDTTAEMNFVFWVRCRDPIDSTLYDPVPDFQIVSVIEARRELDVLVVDVGQAEAINRPDADSVRAFWDSSINSWRSRAAPATGAFLPQRDFIRLADHQNDRDFLLFLMKYKVMVLFQDAVTSSIFGIQETGVVKSLYDALQSGLNTWLAMRTPLGSFAQGSEPSYLTTGATYRQYFGVEQLRYPGWSYYARRAVPQVRMEDFIGVTSQDTTRWPHQIVDSSLLHRRYTWPSPYYHWVDSLAALPGVGYCEIVDGAEVMYTYKSLYGSEHFLGEEHSYQGLTVMHRFETETARTVHSLFTPLCLAEPQAQVLVSRVLDWLAGGEDP